MTEPVAVVGIDVGGTKIAAGLFLGDGKTVFERTVPTSQESAESSIAQIVELVREAVSRAPRGTGVNAVGIVVPGWVNRGARTVWAPNVAGWDHIPLERRLAETVGLPVVLESDRSGYVKGEAWLGVARGLTDVVFLAVGTGIGAGILSGGQLIHGQDDLAGAVGWMALNPAFTNSYAEVGCFEAEASGTAVARKGLRHLTAFAGSAPVATDVFRAAEAGNAEASRIVDEAVLYVAMGVANLVSTLNPGMVVLGGGLFQQGEALVERIRAEFVRWAQPFAARRVRIELSALGSRAGLVGAAALALEKRQVVGC